MKKKAFITGITGQDGSYLAELLLSKGYEVHGLVRRSSVCNLGRIQHLKEIVLHQGDMGDGSSLKRIIGSVCFDEIYNLAAMSHVKLSFDMPEYTMDVDAVGVVRLLEAVRQSCPEAKVYHASTSELFGKVREIPQSEDTPFYPRSPYGVAKLCAYWAVVNYREAYNLFACNGILFNHESPRRGDNFVTKKITLGVAKIKNGLQDKIILGNLDSKRDWGFAGDFVEGMWRMLQQKEPEDFVLATGKTTTVRQFVELAFRRTGVDLVWEGEGVEERGLDRETGILRVEVSADFFRPTEVDVLIGDPTKAKRLLGWEPTMSVEDLVNLMVEEDLLLLKKMGHRGSFFVKELCFDARMISMSGIGVYIRNLLIRLKNGPFKLRLIINKEDLAKWPFLVDFDLILMKSKIYSIQEQFGLLFSIPKCDLFWSPHFNIPLGYIRAKKRVVTIHDVLHLAFIETLSLPEKIYAKFVISQAAQRSDLIFTDSLFSKQELIKYTGVVEKKIEVIHCGLDAKHFHAEKNEENLECIRKKYQLPKFFFLFVGNMVRHKNIKGLLKAFAHLEHDFPEWKLIFAGKIKKYDDQWDNALNNNPRLKSRVHFLGFVEDFDLPYIYQLAYALVHPSFYEGFGLTPLEAMSCGCPTIVSNTASLPEVCGDNSLYVDPYNPEDIANGMRRMILDCSFRNSFCQKGLDWSKNFHWDKTAEGHIQLLEKLC